MLFERKRTENQTSGAKKLTINKARCPQNHACPSLKVCPSEALTQKGFAAPEVDQAKCISCSKCVRYCPMGAIVLN